MPRKTWTLTDNCDADTYIERLSLGPDEVGGPASISSLGNSLIGGVIGFVEAWLLWLIVLLVLGNFLHSIQATIHTGSQVPGRNITVQQYQAWRDTYNQAVHNSLFARVNGIFIKELPALPHLG